MTASNNNMVYKVIFEHQEKIYELYATHLTEGALIGFIELEGLIFSSSHSLVVDPGVEKVRQEFQGVTRTYVPVHAVLRIDEVAKQGLVAVSSKKDVSSNVTPFPQSEDVGLHSKNETDQSDE